MNCKKSLLSVVVTAALTSYTSASLHAQEVSVPDKSIFTAKSGTTKAVKQTSASGMYIVQLKDKPGIARAQELGELVPSNQLVTLRRNSYHANTPNITAYTQQLKAKQAQLAANAGSFDILHSYTHTFNGFSAKLTPAQANALRGNPEVAAVYVDELYTPETANTPEFLGLTGANGPHTLDIKGEDVIVGILDTGIWPENPSFADDGTYSDPADIGWLGACDIGDEAGAGENGEDTFQCNNKLIGARFFGETFSQTYDIQFALGEFNSPRDADGHGSHTASTAAGNEVGDAIFQGVSAGSISGMAPRARIAAYKVCWNSSYVSPEGVNERGCFFGDSMAAIDQAVVDGVDVLNYSIGNSNNINTPVYNAALRAAQAGVFFSASAGNGGPGAATTSNIAPWITTVGASTYDGTSLLVGNSLEINVDGQDQAPIFSIHGGITAPVPAEGFSGQLAAIDPIRACNSDGDVTNPGDLDGKIALIARGACAFSEKILNAQNAGAVGVVVYTDNRTPIAMGGSGAGITIPGVMIENQEGLDLVSQLGSGSVINVTMTFDEASGEATEVGNVMASFSSRGQNPQTDDIIKPDITAPGVTILAATSTDQLNIPGNVDGEEYLYLSGTSMSSPHIAGLGALLIGENRDWSPAQVKSALMTTARQDVVKEDGSTAADPFDFGAGHVDPVPSMSPGLTYQANFGDYLGFLCGQGETGLVESLSDTDCPTLEGDGFAFDASQLNYPSIAIGTLTSAETVSRTVTDVSGQEAEYSIQVDAPAGIDVSVQTFDSEGNETEALVVPANGTASYALTFSRGEGFTPDEYAFGSVTLTGSNGNVVRSPISIKPKADVLIEVPERLSLQLNRGRASFPVKMNYSGSTSIEYGGLSAPFGVAGEAPRDEDQTFNFAEGLATASFWNVPEGTEVVRFTLSDSLIDVEDADLDLYVYQCTGGSCTQVGSSTNASSNEDVMLVNPEPRANGATGDLYIAFVHAWSSAGAEVVNFTMPTWYVIDPESTTRISTSRRAVSGRYNNVRISTRGLEEGFLYMGAVTFFDDNGQAQGTTVLEVQP